MIDNMRAYVEFTCGGAHRNAHAALCTYGSGAFFAILVSFGGVPFFSGISWWPAGLILPCMLGLAVWGLACRFGEDQPANALFLSCTALFTAVCLYVFGYSLALLAVDVPVLIAVGTFVATLAVAALNVRATVQRLTDGRLTPKTRGRAAVAASTAALSVGLATIVARGVSPMLAPHMVTLSVSALTLLLAWLFVWVAGRHLVCYALLCRLPRLDDLELERWRQTHCDQR
jgi:hypothetical protein